MMKTPNAHGEGAINQNYNLVNKHNCLKDLKEINIIKILF